jgi:predicted CoA-binding protein
MLSEAQVKELLERARTIAVVGLSDNPMRESHSIAAFLQRQGYRVLPVNPNLRGPVLGEQPYGNLREVDLPIDIVNVFRRSQFVAGVIEDALASGAGAVWTQSGVVDEAAARRAEAAGLQVVMNRCIAVAYRVLGVRRVA